ncbi:MAG: nucleotidyltransferase [Acidimicrobiales bacterium]
MDRNAIEEALLDVAETLDRRGVRAQIYLVGGAAMVLAFHSRFTTDDVDGSVYPTEEVLAVAAEVASRRGLKNNWLSDSAKIFVPVAKEPEWRPVYRVGSIEIVAADERTMLAITMRASRGRRDEDDIEFLLATCCITSELEALSLYNEFFPEDPLPQRSRPMLRRALERRDSPPVQNG